MRVAFVTGGLALGGTTTFLCNLAGELVRRGISVQVFSFERENPMATDFQRKAISTLCLDDRRMIFEDRMQSVLQELGHFEPTAVVANLAPSSFETLRYIPPGICRIGTGQSDHPDIYEGLKRYAPYMDTLVVVSQRLKQLAIELPELAGLTVHYLPCGVPFPSSVARVRSFRGPLRILYFGRLIQEQKRVRQFPAIFKYLKSSGIPFHWTIAGDGPERKFLERAMTGVPTQTVSFPGKIAYINVPRILLDHDVFLLASDHEGLPLSLLEAMGHGLVPVVSDLPSGIPEVVDETNGIRVPVADVIGYAHAIIHLHNHRDELAAKSAAASARVGKEFSVAAMTDRWLAVLPETAPRAAWPKRWRIQPMLAARHPIYFSAPMRVLRRLAIRFRS